MVGYGQLLLDHNVPLGYLNLPVTQFGKFRLQIAKAEKVKELLVSNKFIRVLTFEFSFYCFSHDLQLYNNFKQLLPPH